MPLKPDCEKKEVGKDTMMIESAKTCAAFAQMTAVLESLEKSDDGGTLRFNSSLLWLIVCGQTRICWRISFDAGTGP